MERLSLEQHATMCSIYNAPRNKWLVKTPSCKVSTITALYNVGYILTDRVYQGQVLRFKLTTLGEEYGREYCRPNKNTTGK